jgi:hypothetical protein
MNFARCLSLESGSLPSAALGEVLLSVKTTFTESRTLGTSRHSAKTALPSAKHSTKVYFHYFFIFSVKFFVVCSYNM